MVGNTDALVSSSAVCLGPRCATVLTRVFVALYRLIYLTEMLQLMSYSFTRSFLWPDNGGRRAIAGISLQLDEDGAGLESLLLLSLGSTAFMWMFIASYYAYNSERVTDPRLSVFAWGLYQLAFVICYMGSTFAVTMSVQGAAYMLKCSNITSHDLDPGFDCFTSPQWWGLTIVVWGTVLVYLPHAIRVRIMDGYISVVRNEASVWTAKRNDGTSVWQTDISRQTIPHYHVLVPSQRYYSYVMTYLLTRVLVVMTNVIFKSVVAMQALVICLGLLIILYVVVSTKPFIEPFANALTVGCVATALWCNVCAVLNVLAGADNVGTVVVLFFLGLLPVWLASYRAAYNKFQREDAQRRAELQAQLDTHQHQLRRLHTVDPRQLQLDKQVQLTAWQRFRRWLCRG